MAALFDCEVKTTLEPVSNRLAILATVFPATLTEGEVKIPVLSAIWEAPLNNYVLGIQFEYGPSDMSSGSVLTDNQRKEQLAWTSPMLVAGKSYSGRYRAVGVDSFGSWIPFGPILMDEDFVANDVASTSPTIIQINNAFDDLVAAYGSTVAAAASAAAAAASQVASTAAAAVAELARDAAEGYAETSSFEAGVATTASGLAVTARNEAQGFASAASTSASTASAASTAAGDFAAAADADRLSAQTANTNAGIARDAAVAAQAGAAGHEAAAANIVSLAARVGLNGGSFANASPSFSGYVQTTGSFPPGWTQWVNGAAHTVVAGQVSDKATRWVAAVDTNVGILAESTNAAHFKSAVGPGWWVVEGLATLEAGSLQGAGYLVTTNLLGHVISFTTEPDSTGAVVGAGVAGRTYSFSKLLNFAAGTTSLTFYQFVNWDGFGARAAKTITFHLSGIRRASAAEVETGVARSTYGSVSARMTAEETVRASQTAALASRATATEALVRAIPNKIINSDASQGMRGWTGAAYVVGADPSVGTYFLCQAAGNHFLQSDFITVTPNTVYTLSFEADGGSVPTDTAIYFSGYNAASVYIEDGLGLTNFTGAPWFSPKKTTFTTGASTTKLRVTIQKGTSTSLIAVSRMMLIPGTTAAVWNDYATARDLYARTSIVETSIADAQAKLAVARIVLAVAATGGRPARFIIQSDSFGGSFAALDASKIYFGDNTVFDDVSDTLQSVTGSVRNVLAWGPDFGASNLREWMGDSSIALSAMSRANAIYYRSSVAPYIGGSGFAGNAPLAVGVPGFASGSAPGGGYIGTNSATVTVTGGTGGSFTVRWVKVIGENDLAPLNEFGSTTTFGGTVPPGGSRSAGFVAYVTQGGATAVSNIIDVSILDSN